MALRSYFYFPETELNGVTDPLRQLPASLQVRWPADLLTPGPLPACGSSSVPIHRPAFCALRTLWSDTNHLQADLRDSAVVERQRNR